MEPTQDGSGGQGHQVVTEMVEMDQPAFVPAAQHHGERDTLLHRIAPQQSAGSMDGQQGPAVTVYSRIASRIRCYSLVMTWLMNLLRRGRRRDDRLCPFCFTRCKKCLVIFSIRATVAGVVVFLVWYFSNPNPSRVKGRIGNLLRPLTLLLHLGKPWPFHH